MSGIKTFFSRHPRLLAWLVLAVGMVAILIWAAKDVGLLAGQWTALIVSTILLAGLCVWIIGWESGDDESLSDEGDS
jgi:protein-S-isoprenylcysteine O-methyltransferase Ste14